LVVGQQAKVVKQDTDLKVGTYYGEMNIDAWKSETWEAELEKNELLHSPFRSGAILETCCMCFVNCMSITWNLGNVKLLALII